LREVVTRCDVCGTDEDVSSYRISHRVGDEEEIWDVEICPKTDSRHSKPILVLMQKGQKRMTTPGTTARPGLTALDGRIRGVPPLEGKR
jgi:hypothetical protein